MSTWQRIDWGSPGDAANLPRRRHFWPWALLLAAISGITFVWWWLRPVVGPAVEFANAPVEQFTNATFTREPADPLVSPDIRMIRLPTVPGNGAIWGATGRDNRGHVWVGVSIHNAPRPSARLFEFDPVADRVIERGDVLTALASTGQLRDQEVQPKIHSKIVQASDGRLYFTSMNETADEGGPKRPEWGSHLWRVTAPDYRWEHLLSLPDGMIALTNAGNLLYSLGFPDHRLVQYDCRTGRSNGVTVGSSGGHISRNLFADTNGHVYVPRIQPGAGGAIDCFLVEFDTALREVIAHPLAHYLNGDPASNHGIVGFQHLPDRTIAFVTHLGRLYRVIPDEHGPSTLVDLGWLHPKGEAYAPSLFTYSGKGALLSVGRLTRPTETKYQWLCYDLRLKVSFELRFSLPESEGHPLSNVLLYGSETRDAAGNFYLGGWYNTGHGFQPLFLQVRPKNESADK